MKKIVFAIAVSLVANIAIPNSGVLADSTTAIDVSFGTQLTAQEQSGYSAYTGATMLDNFYQAKAELPEEVPVLDNFIADGANEFYVSPDASGTGTEEAPFGSIGEALDAVKALSDGDRANGTVIWLDGGTYTVETAMEISNLHTSENAPLFISAYNGEAVISGQNKSLMSQAEKVSKYTVSSGDYNRVNNKALDKLYYIDYSVMGIDTIPYGKAIFYNDTQMNVARYPNQGGDTPIEIITDGSWTDSEGFLRAGRPAEWKSYDEHPFEWVDTGNIHIYGRLANDWSVTDGLISLNKTDKTIKTTDSGLMTNDCPITTNFYGKTSTSYYYLNVFEELDTAGEFYADNTRQRLYFYPPADVISDNDTIGFSQNDGYIFEVNNASNVVFDNINIINAANGIKISDSSRVVIQASEMKNIEACAVDMYNTEKCGIINSSIGQSDSGSLIKITQSNDRAKELKPRRNFVQNTYIYNAPKAMTVGGVTSGNIISHNLIENIDYSGITLNGAENIIEYNEFSGVTNKISDGGAIYVGGNILYRANTIRYNYFHDSKPDTLNARAIYNDDCSDMSWNYGNIVKNYSFGLFQHSGDDHVIMDNIVINTTTYIRNSEDYSAQQGTMAGHLFKKTLPGFWNIYESLKIGESETWTTRYAGIIAEKRQAVYDAREAYHSDSAMFDKVQTIFKKQKTYDDYSNGADVKKVCDIVADTGCYYLNNTLVINGENKWGYGPSNYGLTNIAEPANVWDEPIEIIMNSKDETDSYDISAKIADMGLISANTTEANAPVIYMENNAEIENADFTGISWSEASNSSYYKLDIATDPKFENIVVSTKTSSKEYSRYKFTYNADTEKSEKVLTDEYVYENDIPYYARVTAVSLANCAGNANIESSIVEFTLKEKIEYDRAENKTIIEYGDTSCTVTVTGEVPSYLLNQEDKQVTVVLYDGAKGINDEAAIKQIRQINPNSDNTFSYSFKADDTENMYIRIRNSDKDITDDLFNLTATVVDEIKFNITNDDITVGDVISAAAEVDNKFNIVDEFTILIAAYDSNHRMLQCTKSESFTPEKNKASSEVQMLTVPEDTAYIKAFMWQMTELKSWSDMQKKDLY